MNLRVQAGAALAMAISVLAYAQPSVQKTVVSFARGPATAVDGTVEGDQIVDYAVHATAGQTLSVALTATNRSIYFNVTAPGADTALFVGSTSGHRFRRRLVAGGEYIVRLYLMRNAARRGESGTYHLAFALTPSLPESRR
jgi:hypothetical protein